MPEPYYQSGGITIYCGDAREIVPALDSKALCLTDPPWGISANTDTSRFAVSASGWWKNADRSTQQRNGDKGVRGDDVPFDPVHLLRFEKLIVWGGHCFADQLPPSAGWLVWDKRKGIEDCSWPLSEGELAWTNTCKGVRFFRHRWMGLVRESEQGEHYHPTQKPVALMRWCIEKYAGGRTVIDPYMGAGATLRAAKDLGVPAVGIELEEKYAEIAVKRLAQEVLPFA